MIHAEKDLVQRRYNWEILGHFFDPTLLLSDNIVMKAKKDGGREDRARP